MKRRIGMVTMGQSPRADIMPGMLELLGPDVEVIEKGALDGLSPEAIQSLYPSEGAARICTRLADGGQAVIAKENLVARLQWAIQELDGSDLELIIFLCTGQFPKFESRFLILEAQRIVGRFMEAVVSENHKMGVMVPLAEQKVNPPRRFAHITPRIVATNASPYGSQDEIHRAAEFMSKEAVDLVVMHCMGYTKEHKKIVRDIVGKPVLQPNAIVARAAAELLQI